MLCCKAAVAAAQPPAPPASNVWSIQNSGTNADLRGIDAVSASVAWASGSDGTILRTIDGGAHWTRCSVPDAAKDGATLDFRGIQAWDAQTAVAMAAGPGDASRIYRTIDGCKSWTLLFKNPNGPNSSFACLFFSPQQPLGKNTGFGLLLTQPVAGQFLVYETRNGGAFWMPIGGTVLAAPPGAAAFAASNSCIAGFGGASFDFVVGGTPGSSLMQLTYQGVYWVDDGSPLIRLWTKEALPLAEGVETDGARSISEYAYFPKSRHQERQQNFSMREVAVGGDSARPNDSAGTAVWTTDSGQRWKRSDKPPHGFRTAVEYSESLNAWITVGPNGSDISRDDGRTWQPLGNGDWNALSLPFAVGPNGRIAQLNAAALPARK